MHFISLRVRGGALAVWHCRPRYVASQWHSRHKPKPAASNGSRKRSSPRAPSATSAPRKLTWRRQSALPSPPTARPSNRQAARQSPIRVRPCPWVRWPPSRLGSWCCTSLVQHQPSGQHVPLQSCTPAPVVHTRQPDACPAGLGRRRIAQGSGTARGRAALEARGPLTLRGARRWRQAPRGGGSPLPR